MRRSTPRESAAPTWKAPHRYHDIMSLVSTSGIERIFFTVHEGDQIKPVPTATKKYPTQVRMLSRRPILCVVLNELF